MEEIILQKALDRYRIAKKAIERMQSEKTLESQEDEWFTFLRAWKGIYTCLEQGVKSDAKATMWFGQRNSTRRKDPLLQYLYQARNDDEHGLTRTTARQPASVIIGRPIRPGRMKLHNLNISMGGGRVNIEDRGSENIDFTPVAVDAHLTLCPVRDRDKKTIYYPPKEHLGTNIDFGSNPIAVAEAALRYVDGLLLEAKKL